MDTLDRLHLALLRALEEDRRDALGTPVTVAEIYQDLVPYRLIRADLGFEMNADYEHTVLRLLAGERELAELEPAEARSELRRELDSPNPNVGLFRKFAGCDVRLRPGAHGHTTGAAEAPEAAPVDVPAEEAPPDTAAGSATTDEAPPPRVQASDAPRGEAAPDPEERGPDAGRQKPGMAAVAAESASSEPASGDGERDETVLDVETGAAVAVAPQCAFCDEDLPVRRAVRYCPFCGADQTCKPCLVCGETLERAWRFCINCGSEAAERDG